MSDLPPPSYEESLSHQVVQPIQYQNNAGYPPLPQYPTSYGAGAVSHSQQQQKFTGKNETSSKSTMKSGCPGQSSQDSQQSYPAQAQQYPRHAQQYPSQAHQYPTETHHRYNNTATNAAYGQTFVPGQTVIVPDCFDSGARFSNMTSPSIPPPPPGVAPNAAQLAAQSGAKIVSGQKKSDFWTGSKGAGWTFW